MLWLAFKHKKIFNSISCIHFFFFSFLKFQHDLKWKVEIGGCSVQRWHFWHIFVVQPTFSLCCLPAHFVKIYLTTFVFIFWKIYLKTFVFMFCQNIYDNFCSALDRHNITQAIFFDISKAFDRICAHYFNWCWNKKT